MRKALAQAELAAKAGEVPVGAVVVHNSEIIGEGHNLCIANNDPSAHAEVVAIKHASRTLQNYRLLNTTLYVTLEPCAMCAGLMVHSRIQTLVFGAHDAKTGAAGSMFNLVQNAYMNHQIEVVSGVLEQTCSSMLSDFFKNRRLQKTQ